MPATRLLLAAAGCLLALPALAQPLTVVSTQPADHAVNVPLAATLALTFSAPVAEAGAPVLVVIPADAAVVGVPVRSADGRTLSFPATLQPNTRYVALLLDAASVAGPRLAVPLALNFTTGASNGGFTVRGNVAAAGGLAPAGSIVALASINLTTGAFELVAADVVEGAGASLPYVLGPVPFAVYTAGAVLLPLPLGASAGVGYGLYDPDGDGTPNPIFSPTGNNIVVAPPPPRTAGDGFADVQAAATDALPNGARLVEIDPAVVDAQGASPVWSYRFQSNGTLDEVRIVRLGLFTLPVPMAGDGTGLPEVVLGPHDSDNALAAAEASGGADFRAAHAAETITVTAAALPGFSDTVIVWEIVYRASGGDELSRVIPYGVDAAEVDAAGSRRLALRSANPARGTVRAALSLDAPGAARVAVVDAQGRTVAVLIDGALAAGETALAWTPAAGVPAGTYWLVARTAAGTESVAVTLVR